MRPSVLPFLLLLALVGAATVPAAYDAGLHTTRAEKVSPRVRAALARYRQAPEAMSADSVYWLGGRLTQTNGLGRAYPMLGRRLKQEAEARGSLRMQVDHATFLLIAKHQHTAGRRLLVDAMQRGEEDRAFFMATLAYAGIPEVDGLPAHPDSLVLFYRRVCPLGGEAATRTVQYALQGIERKADAGRADAQQMRADLQARGLWEIDG